MDLHASQTYVVNGKTYTSLDDMPPAERALFESVSNVFVDNNKNGVPDIMDGMAKAGTSIMASNTIIYDGKTFASVNDMPPEGRAAYEKAMGKIASKLADANQNGTPDVIENAINSPQMFVSTQTVGTPQRVVVQQAAPSNIGPIVVLGIVAIGLAVVILLLFGLLIAKGGI